MISVFGFKFFLGILLFSRLRYVSSASNTSFFWCPFFDQVLYFCLFFGVFRFFVSTCHSSLMPVCISGLLRWRTDLLMLLLLGSFFLVFLFYRSHLLFMRILVPLMWSLNAPHYPRDLIPTDTLTARCKPGQARPYPSVQLLYLTPQNCRLAPTRYPIKRGSVANKSITAQLDCLWLRGCNEYIIIKETPALT